MEIIGFFIVILIISIIWTHIEDFIENNKKKKMKLALRPSIRQIFIKAITDELKQSNTSANSQEISNNAFFAFINTKLACDNSITKLAKDFNISEVEVKMVIDSEFKAVSREFFKEESSDQIEEPIL